MTSRRLLGALWVACVCLATAVGSGGTALATCFQPGMCVSYQNFTGHDASGREDCFYYNWMVLGLRHVRR